MKRSQASRRGVLNVIVSAGVAMSLSAWGVDAAAQTRVTYKSAKTGSSYYQMGVEIAEAMKAGTDGRIIVTVEESQGSVQNVMEARPAAATTCSPRRRRWSARAQEGKGPFEDKAQPEVRRDPRAVPDPVADDALRRARRRRHHVVRRPRRQDAAARQGHLRRHRGREVPQAVRPRRQGQARRRRARQRACRR